MYLFNKNACSYFAIIILFFLFFYPHEMTHMAGECTLDPHSLTEQSGINREMYERQIQHPCSTVYQRVETLRSSKTLLFRPPLSGDVNSPPASAPEGIVSFRGNRDTVSDAGKTERKVNELRREKERGRGGVATAVQVV